MKNYILLYLFLITSFTLTAQTTYYVKAGGLDTNTGLTEQEALSTVSQALINAVDNDIITIVGSISQTGQVAISKSVSFVGQSNAIITGVDGGVAKMYVVTADALTASFSNITFTGSINKNLTNGAVFSILGNSNITFTECTFDGNSTSSNIQGGAIYIEKGTINITNSLFKDNISGKSGGAIYINAGPNPDVYITGCTFYNNLAQGTLGSDGGGAILSEGNTTFPGQLTITNCTFFENKITKTSLDYGAIRSTNTNISVTNSLFYGNKVDGGNGASSDFGAAPGGSQSFTYSIGEWISSNVDTRSNFISFVKGTTDPNEIAADLSASNLRFDATLGKVIYDNVSTGVHSPIDYGSDGHDVGSWNSGYTLSFEDFDVRDAMVIYEKQNKRIQIQHSSPQALNIEIYNVLGTKVLSARNIQDEHIIDVTKLTKGLYFVVARNNANSITKKILIH